MVTTRRLVQFALAACVLGSAAAQASGPSLPPKEVSAVVEATCDFARAELRYANRWSIREGHHAAIRSLILKKDGAESPPHQEKLDQLSGRFFAGQERIDGVSASCYEDRLIIFNIRTSTLRTEAGKMRWVEEVPLHLTIGTDGISIAKSPTAQD